MYILEVKGATSLHHGDFQEATISCPVPNQLNSPAVCQNGNGVSALLLQ